MSRALIVIAVVIGLPVIALIALLLLLDNPDAYKARLSSTFQDQTGLGLEINGDISWRYMPPIAINISSVSITTPASEQPLASVGSASIDLKLMPLLFGGNVEINGLDIDGLEVNAVVDAAGKGNWEVSDTTSTKDNADPAFAGSDSGASNLKLDISSTSFTNAKISYVDNSTNSDYELNIEDITTGPLVTGALTSVYAHFTATDKVENMVAKVALAGEFAVNEGLDIFQLDNLVIETGATLPDMPEITSTLTLNGSIDTSKETAQFNKSSLALAGMDLQFNMDLTKLFGTPGLSGNISAPSFNARNLLASLDADIGETANPDALKSVSFSADVKGTTDRVQLSHFKAKLDNSNIDGSLTAAINPAMAFDFSLAMDKIIASDYLAPTVETTSAGAAETSTDAKLTIEDSEVIPTEFLRDTNLNGSFKIADLTYDTYHVTDLNLKVQNKNKQLDITTTAKAYDGDINFALRVANPGSKPTGTSTLTVKGIDIAKAVEFDSITGHLGMEATHAFNGNMMSNIVNTLDGKSTFEIANGTVDVQAIKQLAGIVGSLQGKTYSISEWPDMLPFKQLLGSHSFVKGIAKDQTFDMAFENMKITGTGGIDYFGNTMNYDLEATLLENVGGQFTVNPQIANIRWPLHCEGSLDADPIDLCLPDRSAVTNLIKDLATQELKRKGRDAINKKIEKKIPDELKEKAKGLLKGLFN